MKILKLEKKTWILIISIICLLLIFFLYISDLHNDQQKKEEGKNEAKKSKIAILIPIVGKFGKYAQLFFMSAKYNTQFDWLFFTDKKIDLDFTEDQSPFLSNVKFILIENNLHFIIDRVFKAIGKPNHKAMEEWKSLVIKTPYATSEY